MNFCSFQHDGLTEQKFYIISQTRRPPLIYPDNKLFKNIKPKTASTLQLPTKFINKRLFFSSLQYVLDIATYIKKKKKKRKINLNNNN